MALFHIKLRFKKITPAKGKMSVSLVLEMKITGKDCERIGKCVCVCVIHQMLYTGCPIFTAG